MTFIFYNGFPILVTQSFMHSKNLIYIIYWPIFALIVFSNTNTTDDFLYKLASEKQKHISFTWLSNKDKK